MKKISNSFVAFFCCITFFSLIATAQKPQAEEPSENVMQMKKLTFMIGTWKGTGWMMRGRGKRSTSTITENAQFKLGGSAVLVEGLGKSNGKIVHNALGFLTFDTQQKKFLFTAYLANGKTLVTSPQISDGKLVWGFSMPNGGQTRFTLIINKKGNWFEIGEYSRDGGKTWFKTMEMELEKIK